MTHDWGLLIAEIIIFFFIFVMVFVLLSAHAETFSVSCMQDFLSCSFVRLFGHSKKVGFKRHRTI